MPPRAAPLSRLAGFSRPEGLRFSRWVVISVVLAGVITAIGLSVYDRVLNVRDASAESRVAAVAGPPCPSVTKADFAARHLELRFASEFNGVSFARRFGQVSCSEAAAKGWLGLKSYSVCQFSSPDVLAVRTAKGLYYFEPGLGRKASLLMDGDAPRCVMAAPDWS